MVRFLHTADWQIGKPFAGISDSHKRHIVQQERIAVLARIAAAAAQHRAAFILVAGDMFDSPTPTQAMVSAACRAIGEMQVPVYAIPGNHDHGGPGGLWGQPFFLRERESLAPNLHVLAASEPVVLDEAVLFPCPLLRRAESSDTTAWLRDPAVLEQAGGKVRLLLAHGSTLDFSGEREEDEAFSFASNHLDLARLNLSTIDYIALGDWHGTKQVGPMAWYSGTPERDRFPKGEANLPGHVLAVSVARGGAAEVLLRWTNRLAWHNLERDLSDVSAVEDLRDAIENLVGPRTQEDLLRLELSGALGLQATTQLEALLETYAARLLRVKFIDHTVVAPAEEEVFALTQRLGDPLMARVAAQLVTMAADGDEEKARVARVALRELHAVCHAR